MWCSDNMRCQIQSGCVGGGSKGEVNCELYLCTPNGS